MKWKELSSKELLPVTCQYIGMRQLRTSPASLKSLKSL